MAGGARVVIGADISAVKPAIDSVVRSVQNGANQVDGSFQGWVGNTNAVATATEKLERQLKGFASEQRTQGRMARFYAGEIASIIPAAGGASSALQGLLGIGLEGLAGGLGIGVAFESIKFAVGMASEAMKEHAERLKAVEGAQLAVTAAVMAGKDALDALSRGTLSDSEQAYRSVFKAATEGIKDFQKEADKLRPTTWQLVKAFIWDGALGMQRLQEQANLAAAGLDRIVASASNQAEIARALTQESQKAAQAGAANRVLADDYAKSRTAAAAAAAKEAREQARISGLIATTMDRMGDAAAADRGNFPDMFYSQATADQLKKPETVVDAAAADRGNFPDLKSLKELNAESREMQDIWSTIGGAVSSAFSSIGTAVGGVAGKVIGWLGQMITQAIALAVSLAAAGMAWSSPLGVVATAGLVTAGLLALVASIPSYDVGSEFVPRTQLAMVHRGERIITAEENARGGGGGSLTLNFNAPVDATWWRQNERHIVRTLREAQRSGRAG